jgi:hypothetical protein
MTIAGIPLWFELFQTVVARTRLRQALSYAEPGSDQEMRLRIAIGHALWYIGPESAAIEPIFARALEIAERIGAAAVRTQALWGCGPHAAVAAIIPSLSKWRADSLMSPKVPATSAPCTLRTASSD